MLSKRMDDVNGKTIQAIFYDCDGVLTDNRVLVDETGKESLFFNRSDGLAISKIREDLHIHQAIISTETNPVVVRRAEKLKIPVIHGVSEKGEILKKYAEANNIDLEASIFVGNDINDLAALKLVGYKCCPHDAENEVKSIADWISEKNGGYGVVRDLYNVLMRQ